jgi:hypothetical protein
MKKCKERVWSKWSKKESDWIFRYPEYKNSNGRITAKFISGMIETADNTVRSLGYENLRDYFEKGGFDPDTFTISINAKHGSNNIRVDGKPNS